MDPFRIICPACSTKLVVRQPELVGRTVPCPKCKNAIHVVKPGEVAWNPGTVNTNQPPVGGDSKKPTVDSNVPRRPVSTVNSEAITKADPGDWDLDALESALAQQNPPSGDLADGLANGGFFREAGSDSNPGRRKDAEPFAIQPLDPSSSTASTATATPSAWQSPQAKARRQLLTLFVVGLSGCLLAALAFIAFLNIYGKRNRDKPPGADNPALVAQDAPAANPANPANQANQGNPPELIAEAGPKIEAIQPVPQGDPMEPTAQAAPGLKLNPLGIPPENLQPNDPENNPANINPGQMQLEQATPKTNPAELGQASEAQGAADENLPSIFKDFLPVFDRSSQPGWSDLGKEGDKTIDQELSIENAEIAFATEYYPQPIPLPNWAERAERKLGRIRTPPMSLPRFVDWINRVSGHAISVDWFLFNLSDIPLEGPFSLQSEGTTVGGILEELKTKVGAQVDTDAKGFLYVRPAAEKLSSKLKPDGSTELGPLSKGLPEGQDQAILKLVLDMLQVDGCEYKDGKLTWGPDANAYQQAQVLAALASIREANAGGAAASSVFDFNRPAAWMALFRQSQKKLGPDEILHEERPIVDIMVRAAQSSGLELLMDWPAVWSHGLHPNRMALSLLRGRTMLEVSNRFLDDHSLELVPLDGKTWALTTEAQRRSMIRIVAVRTDRGVSLEDMRVSLRGVVPRGMDGKSMFRASSVPGAEGVVLLRICPPNSSLFADEELVRALGQTP